MMRIATVTLVSMFFAASAFAQTACEAQAVG